MTVVPRELMLELREKRREFREYENEYNKRMSEVEFEQSKGKYDYVQQYLDKLNYILQIAFFTPISPLSSLVALISGVLDTLSARYKLLNTKQHPIPSTRPNTSWMETSITTIIWASIPLTTLELYYCFRAKLTDLFTGGYTPTTATTQRLFSSSSFLLRWHWRTCFWQSVRRLRCLSVRSREWCADRSKRTRKCKRICSALSNKTIRRSVRGSDSRRTWRSSTENKKNGRRSKSLTFTPNSRRKSILNQGAFPSSFGAY
ncbi:hypothetical protein BLNAU_16867 [Blattamonas nauphoetae]|uniref:Uncharacterized protein n=1 Tax=Blattamonas nauphoetae TaxID=2049346 RepID=A0ABQ9WW11_9EUKA|nr:hypothetical protein BLNAU_21403 [Blattamonas nauphoetae]KAK2948158.1 hypothetical protein BLNAU_16867 [Blattamonas nauphoetae]